MRQHTALNILKTGRNVFLTGPAGSGKTHVLREYLSYLSTHGIPVAVTASTGIAATHLGGQTIHSWSGIGVRDHLTEWDLDSLSQKEYLVRRMRKTAVLIVDEISMLSADFLEMLDTLLRTLRQDERSFGGVQVVFAGDFFQLPPVVRGKKSFLRFSYEASAWKEANIRSCYLTEQFRQQNDPLADILTALRTGTLTAQHKKTLTSRLHAQTHYPHPTILFTHNKEVDSYNEKQLAELSGREKHFNARMSGSQKIAASLLRGMLAPESLKLKKGAAVMFVKNDPGGSYVNGTLGEVVDFSFDSVRVRCVDGKELSVGPADWHVEENGKIRATVSQIPLRLAWAMTVHKSQGMTLDAVRADLSRAFAPGQGYVALSRARTLAGLSLMGLSETALAMEERVVEFDTATQSQSSHWEKIMDGYSDKKIAALHREFVSLHGGETKKRSTEEKTEELLLSGKTVRDVAHERGMTEETIVHHVEKLSQRGRIVPEQFLSIDEKLYKRICAVARTKGWERMAPLKKVVPDASYRDIRVARILFQFSRNNH